MTTQDTTEPLESWQWAWRYGFAPQCTTHALEKLRDALTNDDPKLLQGATTNPPPLASMSDFPCEGACLVGYLGWHLDDTDCLVGEVEEAFARLCFEADQRLGEPAACRWLLNYWDDTPRDTMFAAMLHEVEIELDRRKHETDSSGELRVDCED